MTARAAFVVGKPRAMRSPPPPNADVHGDERAAPDHAALFAALPTACVLLDADDRFRAVNPAAEQFFSLSASHLQHVALDDLVAADSPIFLMVQQVRLHGSSIHERDLAMEGPRLSRRSVAVHASAFLDEPGWVLLTFSDWSAAMALDRQLSFRQAARSVAGMAALLAHEVRNPLSGIRGAAQLLEHTVVEGDRELAVLIREEADRIRALVDRMEAFGDRPLERGAVNIHRVLEHVRKLAASGFAADLRIVERYDPSLPPVWGNRDQLVQVFLNLVKNAAEAMTADGRPGGEITLITAYQHSIRLAAPHCGGAGGRGGVHLPLIVTVRDHGPGIPADVEKTLFDPFVTTKQSGSGLGLALVAKIIGDHGGLIEVDSRHDRTDFRICLPVFPEDGDAPDMAAVRGAGMR
jgi:two-component system nitrogen regulation sensor histidine kinase GlnL